jgi:imidazole glycerol-phosphate synthase subunit HisH
MIVVVDYRCGNVGSILNMLKKVGHQAELSADPARIAAANKLILPGVGAFDVGMQNLADSGLLPVLNERVRSARIPTLGICLGMQLMVERSAEGKLPGLGWISGEAVRFQPMAGALKVPHMGWNAVVPTLGSVLTDDLPVDPRFYFVHSYYIACRDEADVLLRTRYGVEFVSAFHRENIWGVQFHPEKSHKFGMRLLANFAERCD